MTQILRGELGEVPAPVTHAVGLVLNDVAFIEKNIGQLIHPGEAESMASRACSLTMTYFRAKQAYAPQAMDKSVDWRVNIPPESIQILCDSQMIEHRVLANLLVNAFRYTPSGGTVTLGYEVTEKEFYGFVQDTGPGIRKEDQEKLFHPGVQLSKQGGGLAGLGLASVKKVVESHQGKVWIESEWGKGASFFFSLPLDKKSTGV